MTQEDILTANLLDDPGPPVRIIRHVKVCQKLDVSSAKLFDMVAKGQFPKPFTIVPGGRAVGWLENDVNDWIVRRSSAASEVVS